MAITLPLDIDQAGALLAGALQNGLIKTLDMLKTVINTERVEVIKALDKDMTGMREQIKSNGTILLPIIRPELREVALKKLKPRYPTVDVITCGVPGQMQAIAMLGEPSKDQKAVFIHGDHAATTAEALQSLLDITSKLVKERIFDDEKVVIEKRVPLAGGGGYCKRREDASPLTEDDKKWWGPYELPAPYDPFDDEFHGSSSDSGSDSSSVRKITANTSFKQVEGELTPNTSFNIDTSFNTDASYNTDGTNEDTIDCNQDAGTRFKGFAQGREDFNRSFEGVSKRRAGKTGYGIGISMNASFPGAHGPMNGGSNKGSVCAS